jgi:hypothetical protein
LWSAGRKKPLDATCNLWSAGCKKPWMLHAACDQRAVRSPWMLHLPPLGRLANKKIYWPIYMNDHLSCAHWCRRTRRQGISKFCWLTLSVLFCMGSVQQADSQPSSVPIISSTYGIYNRRPKYNCSTHIIIKIPPPHNP